MRTKGMIAAVFVVALIGGSAWAQEPSQSQFAYPGYHVQWHRGEGVPDPDGSKSQQGLHLEKVDPTAGAGDRSGSGIVFGNVGGALTELGFEVRDDGVCGAYPRYKVTTSGGLDYYFRCQSGTHSTSFPNWTRVRFSSVDAEPAAPLQPPFLFDSTEIESLSIAFRLDVGSTGVTHLDNLDINGTLIGKPGR